jgi:type IX secretion system PorP/SprF family membrane protein
MIRKDMAVGTLFSNDITGPLSKFSWQATYAYHLPVGKKDRLSFGLSAQMQYYTLDQSVLVLHHETDDVINGAKQKSLVPDFNFGIYYFGERHFAGVSIPQVFNAKINIGDDVVVRNKERQHMFVHGGYRFQLAEKWMLEPSAIIKMINKAPINVDINTRVEYDKFLWAGISYRHDDSMVALMGLTHNQFRIGYSYDFTTSNIRKYSAGTHELYLQHTLKLSKLSKSSM